MNKFWQDFKTFALKGNVVDLAVGVMVGAAFQSVVSAFTENILSPILGIFGGTNFDQFALHLALPGRDEVSIMYGAFLTAAVNFLIMALVVFVIVRLINRFLEDAKKKQEPEPTPVPTTKKCPYCLSDIPLAATRCPACTSQLGE